MSTENAKITDTHLGPEDHGIMSAMIHLEVGNGAQGFGGYDLRHPRFMLAFVEGMLRVAGVGRWEELRGRYIRVKERENGLIKEVGHITKDEWFRPQAVFEKILEAEEAARCVPTTER